MSIKTEQQAIDSLSEQESTDNTEWKYLEVRTDSWRRQ